MTDIIGSGNKKDKWTKRVTDLLNWLNEKKQATLVAGDNVTLTPQQDGTVEISAGGGAVALDDLTDVDVSSVTDGQALVYDAQNQEWVAGEAGQVDDVKVNGTSVVSNKIAEITSYKEVTQAEYDALTDAQKMNGVAYFIKDALLPSRSNIYAPVIYSTNERMIGVWLDGKPLYQKSKVIPYNAFTTDGYQKYIAPTTELGLSNVDIKGYDGYFLKSDGTYGRYTIGSSVYKSANQKYRLETLFYYNRIALRSYDANGNLYTNTTDIDTYAPDLFLTVIYTKNDDVAGSGNWGTDGIPMVHYSTSEKVIGTWVDGKTLYEKTYALSSRYVINENEVNFELFSIPTNIKIVDALVYDDTTGNNNQGISHGQFSVGSNFHSGYLYIRNNSFTQSGITHITIRYIKTT